MHTAYRLWNFLGQADRVDAFKLETFLYSFTMSNTGKLFERDHTTIIHSIEKIKDQLKEDEELHDRINGLSQMIQK